MVATEIRVGDRSAEIEYVDGVTQTSTNTDTVVTDSLIDARLSSAVSYTISVATDSVDWTVYGANKSDLSDKQAVQSKASVAAAASGTYAVSAPPYGYYAVFIDSTVDDNHGDVTLYGIGK